MMRSFPVVLLILGAIVSCQGENHVNRPISKVVNLLKKMADELENEAEADDKIYADMQCWCTTNDGEKTDAIAAAEKKIKALNASIEELTATSSRLGAEIEEHGTEIEEQTSSLNAAIEQRKKEVENFKADEADLLNSIDGLTRAKEALAKHNPQSELLQTALGDLPRRYLSLLQLNQPVAAKSYNNRSGEIFGVLSNMLETFQDNLTSSQDEENSRQSDFEKLKASKEAEIAATTELKNTKEVAKGDTDSKNNADKKDLKETKETLSGDESFLLDLKERCRLTDREYENRVKTRGDEIDAVHKAIEILNSDEAHENFANTVHSTSFLQTRVSGSMRLRGISAARVLAIAGEKYSNPRLMMLAAATRLNAFTKVKAAIDTMINDLRKEKEDEVKLRDWCVASLNENAKDKKDEENEQEQLTASVGDHTNEIKRLSDEIADLKSRVSTANKNLKHASEEREKENIEFQQMVSEQHAAQATLKRAIEVLSAFYEKQGEALIQQDPAGPAPPVGFKAYEKNSASKAVLAMINQVAEDSEALVKEAVQDETEAQITYETFTNETNKSVERMRHETQTKKGQKAKKEGERSSDHRALTASKKELASLEQKDKDLHGNCDFVLRNFTLRQESRDQEVEALQKAKAILSGSKFS